MWWIVATILSAVFAGLTAILSKCGVKNANSDVATAVRTSLRSGDCRENARSSTNCQTLARFVYDVLFMVPPLNVDGWVSVP